MSKKIKVIDKTKEFVKKHGLEIIAVTGMIMSGACLCYSFGYVAGANDTSDSISRGIEKVWDNNPGLKETMWNALVITAQHEAASKT